MYAELLVGAIVEASNGGFLDGPVHSLSLTTFIHGFRGLISLCLTLFWAQTSSKEGARNSSSRSNIFLISPGR